MRQVRLQALKKKFGRLRLEQPTFANADGLI